MNNNTNKMKIEIKLGSKCRCKVTGFTGIAIGRLEYLNGCVQYGLKPGLDKDGKIQDAAYIDSQQLEVLDEGITVKPAVTGGPSTDAPKAEYRG